MQDLTITLVQANQIWEDKTANFENYERLLHSSTKSDLILLPEMFSTGFSMNAHELAEEMSNSPSIKWLKKIAKTYHSSVYTSLIIMEENHFYNRGVFVYPTGEIDIYDKQKTFGLAGEDKVYTAGKSSQIVIYKGWKINLQICYDLRFPEISLNKIQHTEEALYDLSLYVANWPEKRSKHWNSLLIARAIENQSYVAGVNRVGEDWNNLTYSGDSQLVDPLGNTVILPFIETTQTFTLSATLLRDTRAKLPFLKDRMC